MSVNKKTNKYITSDPNYDWNLARKLYYRAHKLIPNSIVSCGNPDCLHKIKGKASVMQLHHLLERRVAPSLTYEPSNMILLCRGCHNAIHEGWKAYWVLKKKNK